MQGTLSSLCLAEIFRSIFNERRSGELIIRKEKLEKHIYFERGQVVFASSNKPEDRIGETLTRYRKLTREQIEGFVAQLAPGQRLGRALVEVGALTERELVSYVTLQIIDIVYSIFNWSDGTYHFVDGEGLASEELKMKFSTATLIIEGVRRIEDFDTLRRGIGSADLLLAVTAAGRSKMQAVAFSPLELSIINMAKEPMDLLKIMVSCKERPEKVLQAVYGLLSIGMLEQSENSVDYSTARHLPARETGAQAKPQTMAHQMPPPINAGPAAGLDSALVAEIEAMKQRIATRDVRIVLGITPENNANEIYDAYLRLAMRYHPDKHANTPAALRSEVDYIFNAVTESYNQVRANGVPTTPMVAPPPAPMLPSAAPNYGMPPASAYNPYGAPPAQPQPPGAPMPNIRLQQTGKSPVWTTDSQAQYQSPQAGYGAPQSPYQGQQQNYYGQPPPAAPPPNPMAQFQAGGMKRSSITRAVSDELEYTGKAEGPKLPGRNKSVDIERAMSEMLDYFDDRRAPLFAADALTTLLRTKPPAHVGRREVVETIITWARNKASVMGWPIAIILLRVVSLIKQAEQAQLIEDFNGDNFYGPFIQELAGYCTAPEAEEFMRGVGSV